MAHKIHKILRERKTPPLPRTLTVDSDLSETDDPPGEGRGSAKGDQLAGPADPFFCRATESWRSMTGGGGGRSP